MILHAFLALAIAAGASGGAKERTSLVDRSAALLGADFAPAAAPAAAAPAVPAPVPALPAPPPSPAPAPTATSRPDFAYTPGRLCTAQDPDFEEYRYPEHIPYCQRHVTAQMKKDIAAHYGVPESDWGKYEFDHLIPLAIGGDSYIDNIWPEPRDAAGGAGDKDKLEQQLYLQLKAGTITQADAVKRIYAWFGENTINPSTIPHPHQYRR